MALLRKRKPLHQSRRGQLGRLPAVEDHRDDVGREQGEAQDAADVGGVDARDAGDLVDYAVDAALEPT